MCCGYSKENLLYKKTADSVLLSLFMRTNGTTPGYVSFHSFTNINPLCTGNPKRGSLANSEDPDEML